jgi:hypothetical protein
MGEGKRGIGFRVWGLGAVVQNVIYSVSPFDTYYIIGDTYII